MTPHTPPSTRTPVRNRRHASGTTSVSAQVNSGNLPAQSAVFVVVAGSRLARVMTDFAAGHARQALVEAACVVVGVGVRDGSDGAGRCRVEVWALAQGLGGTMRGAGWRGLVHAVASRGRGLLLRN